MHPWAIRCNLDYLRIHLLHGELEDGNDALVAVAGDDVRLLQALEAVHDQLFVRLLGVGVCSAG